jgi:hypothetical protein
VSSSDAIRPETERLRVTVGGSLDPPTSESLPQVTVIDERRTSLAPERAEELVVARHYLRCQRMLL